mmetsp:Transcript_5251/g.10245  ORF Transcript_5251/g.10245 Transcript_5251/m.10245 type:complete len:320 (+) Transcript_5251:1167-2126(+)
MVPIENAVVKGPERLRTVLEHEFVRHFLRLLSDSIVPDHLHHVCSVWAHGASILVVQIQECVDFGLRQPDSSGGRRRSRRRGWRRGGVNRLHGWDRRSWRASHRRACRWRLRSWRTGRRGRCGHLDSRCIRARAGEAGIIAKVDVDPFALLITASFALARAREVIETDVSARHTRSVSRVGGRTTLHVGSTWRTGSSTSARRAVGPPAKGRTPQGVSTDVVSTPILPFRIVRARAVVGFALALALVAEACLADAQLSDVLTDGAGLVEKVRGARTLGSGASLWDVALGTCRITTDVGARPEVSGASTAWLGCGTLTARS